MAKQDRTKRVNLSLSREQKAYLEDLADLGIHGVTATEVAKTLISREIERLVTEGFIGLKKGSSTTKS